MSDDKRTHKGRKIEQTLRTKATPDQVYRAWADPELLSQWFTEEAHGGGEVGSTMVWIWKSFGFEVPYEVVTVDPGENFAVRFDALGFSGLLEIQIEQEGGETVMRLVTSLFKDEEDWDDEFEGIRSGWEMALSLLGHYLENHFEKPKENVLITRPVSADWDRVQPYFHQPEKLSAWLTESGGIPAVGENVELTLRDGRVINGKVLADSGREVAFSWPEANAVCELKGFLLGGQKMAGIRLTFWDPAPSDRDQIQQEFAQATDRLMTCLSGQVAER